MIEKALRPAARGISIVDLAIGSVAALGQRQLRNREFQVPDILYFFAIYRTFTAMRSQRHPASRF
jgi:hypothetical protein